MNEIPSRNPYLEQKLPASCFIHNRQRLLDCLGDRELVLLVAGKAPRRTADEDYPFFTNRNFLYLCGVEQENAILLLFRRGPISREILFIPAPDPNKERWTGRRISRSQAGELSGLREILYLEAFEGIFHDLLALSPDRIWLDLSADNPQAEYIRGWLENRQPDLDPCNLAPQMKRLRMIKDPAEILCLQDAIELTGKGIDAILKNLAPGVMEYQLWSHFQHALALEGSLYPAFPSIVAAGENIFCMHYMNPHTQIESGDLVQIDVGATVGGLCADISRAYPANGRFSPRQLAIYQLVRDCQETAFAMIRPGIRLSEINDRCRLVAQQGLVRLGIMHENSIINEYFWHSVSHHLGLDVHDPADREALLQKGMVLTVEPGIYVPEWHIGLRLEDDVLVTENGCKILSEAIPREAAEIETALQSYANQLQLG